MSSEQSKHPPESFHMDDPALTDSEIIHDSQKREILRRLAECESKPQILESFDEAELEAMIHELSRKK